MSDTVTKFKVLGRDVTYTINDLGKSERLEFDGVELVNSWGGGLGPWDTHEWSVARYWNGAARAAAEHKVLRDYAEKLLAGLLVNIPEIYKEMESCN